MQTNIVFFGSSKYSAIDEKALHEQLGICLVVTLPDRQNSKTKEFIPNPVKKYADENNIPVITAEKITPEIIHQIASSKLDFLVVADYGLILPKALLELPSKASINVHHSLLPKYRGPAPVPFALLNGEKTVGVTIILMNSKIDAGDILLQKTYTVLDSDTADSVLTKLNQIGSVLAIKVIQNFNEYFQKKTVQNESEATFTHYMKREDGFILGKESPEQVKRMIKAYFPWPGVWTKMTLFGKEKIVKLLPGNMLQVEGKKPMTVKDFLNGYPDTKELLQKLGLL